MRTTVAIPDELYHQANGLVGEGSFSRFVREAVQHYVDWLRQQQLTREMEEGYMAEAESPSLDPAWADVEADGW